MKWLQQLNSKLQQRLQVMMSALPPPPDETSVEDGLDEPITISKGEYLTLLLLLDNMLSQIPNGGAAEYYDKNYLQVLKNKVEYDEYV